MLQIIIITASIIGSLVVLGIISYFTPLRYLVYYNILSTLIYAFYSMKIGLKKSCKTIGLKVYPVIPVDKLKKYGLYQDQIGYFMYIWEEMNFGDKVISIQNGIHSYFVGKKDFWGRSSFLDPLEDTRYQLWNGVYIVPIDKVFEKKDDKLIPIEKFGYIRDKKTFNFESALLLIQYDVYIHFHFIYKYLPKELQDKETMEKKFKLRDLQLRPVETPGVEYCYRYRGTVKGNNVMFYKDDLDYKSFSTLTHFGRVGKNSQENFGECLYKGDIVAAYIDEFGKRVDPESDQAKFLVVSYSFGIHWEVDNVKRETPDDVMKDLTDSYVDLKYKPV